MFDFGSFWNLPDYREGWQDKNKSGIARLGRMLDPMTMIPGVKEIANPIHNLAEQGADFGNRVLSPVVGAAQKFTELTTPGLKQVQNAVPFVKDIDRFVKDKPIDAAAIAAATFFTAGAATPALTGAGGAGAGAAGTGAASSLGAAGASSITPTFASGALGAGSGAAGAGSALGAGAASSITPAFVGASEAGAASSGALGAAGTAALNNAIPASYGALSASMPSAGTSLLNSFNNLIKPLKTAKKGEPYYKSLKNFAEPDTESQRNYNIADQLAQRVLNSNTQPDFSRFKKWS